MKNSLAILAVGLLFFFCNQNLYSQTFYVRCGDDRSRYTVYNILEKLNTKLTSDTTEADYIVECHITPPKQFDAKHKGYIAIYDRSGIEISRTKEVKRNACATNGFNAAADIFQVLAEDYLPVLITKIIK